MDAARDLFVADGCEQVTMRKIADLIHYSHTAIYMHFKDRREILQALSEEGFQLMLAFWQTVQHPDPMERLRLLSEAYLRFAKMHPHYYRIMFLAEFRPTIDRGSPETWGHRVYSLVRDAARDAQLAGALDPAENPDRIAHVLWALMHGLASLKLAERFGPLLPPDLTSSQVVDRGVEAVLDGFRPSRREPLS